MEEVKFYKKKPLIVAAMKWDGSNHPLAIMKYMDSQDVTVQDDDLKIAGELNMP